MDPRNTQQDVQDQLNDVVSRLQSKNFFQSDLDIAFFAVFFIFIGMILLLFILVLIRCCCCCCCQDDDQPRRQKRGVVNMALEP
ncbi:small integral membrane protein 22 [Oryzias latipes]|uniref:small integral membrane protein 22 n=1 Tax=Oryzias latipes TaxID=8090 RepID=UPI0009DAC436|nr:small integral membrane protein 22 [Oryzias latipes]XP_023813652.1 small integral membrane protein 22 [Oryzias latipes]